MFDWTIAKADAKFLASLSQVTFSTMDLMNVEGILKIMKEHFTEALNHSGEFNTEPEWVEVYHSAMIIDIYLEEIGIAHAENKAILKGCECPPYEEFPEEDYLPF